jgi:protein tyrosine phosphatase (PTP) superfamily phosphohydrolase (DUF442 family)
MPMNLSLNHSWLGGIRRRGRTLAAPIPAALRRMLAGAVIVLACVFLFFVYIGYFGGNFRTVVPGRVYRSGQLGPAHLDRIIRTYGIRSVISLRGGADHQPWYREESRVCRRLGVRHYRAELRSSALPRPEQAAELVRLFDEAEHPILFHCEGGADRSGLAATLYLHLQSGLSLDEAQRRGLTWHYGHFPGRASAMDRFFDLYRRTAGGGDFRAWLRQEYPRLRRVAASRRD